jgi:hypothetical protein
MEILMRKALMLAAAALAVALGVVDDAHATDWILMRAADHECVSASVEAGVAGTPDEAEALMRATHRFKARKTTPVGDSSLVMVQIELTNGGSMIYFSDMRVCKLAALLMAPTPR